VVLILTKRVSWKASVSTPNTSAEPPQISGRGATRRVLTRLKTMAAADPPTSHQVAAWRLRPERKKPAMKAAGPR
jgi:hypothetical protein